MILEFLAEIPRAFRPTLFYDIWLVVPKTQAGEANTKQIKTIVEKTGVPLLNAKPMIEKLQGKIQVKGITENLWKSI